MAMLRGMGWQEGMGVGRNRKVGDMGSQEGIRVGSNRKVMRGTVWRLWAVGTWGRKETA